MSLCGFEEATCCGTVPEELNLRASPLLVSPGENKVNPCSPGWLLGHGRRILLEIPISYSQQIDSDRSIGKMRPFGKRHLQDQHRDGYHHVDDIDDVGGHGPIQQTSKVDENTGQGGSLEQDQEHPVGGM